MMTLYCSPRGRTGKGRGREGGGLYPELAAYRISEGSSPNVQAEVGRQVGLLPIEQARAELARRGLELGREGGPANRQRAGGADAGDSHPRPAPVPAAANCPPGDEFAGKRVAVGIDGGRVRVRTVIKKVRVGGKNKRKPFQVEWREPKVLIVFETDEKGRMAKGCRPVIDGTLRGPDALIELVAFHLHRLGAAQGQGGDLRGGWGAVDLGAVGLGDRPGRAGAGAGGRGARLVSRRASPEPGVGGVGVWPRSGGPSSMARLRRSAEGGPESRW